MQPGASRGDSFTKACQIRLPVCIDTLDPPRVNVLFLCTRTFFSVCGVRHDVTQPNYTRFDRDLAPLFRHQFRPYPKQSVAPTSPRTPASGIHQASLEFYDRPSQYRTVSRINNSISKRARARSSPSFAFLVFQRARYCLSFFFSLVFPPIRCSVFTSRPR